ncbi:hypothetical protein [Cognatishimia sp. F0-27]|uniref:hypothetical protein n=1 Tax=Cognatishimia sp. F0-27 TaxID=2816855 RepID=UPI001D0C42EB|nr:hypothetical protein [Cognatishimia sp. F0-27]MCC1494173.1 hypothetical protein [Cognatishimia sp. F0-27]
MSRSRCRRTGWPRDDTRCALDSRDTVLDGKTADGRLSGTALERERVQVMKDIFKARLGQGPQVNVLQCCALR